MNGIHAQTGHKAFLDQALDINWLDYGNFKLTPHKARRYCPGCRMFIIVVVAGICPIFFLHYFLLY